VVTPIEQTRRVRSSDEGKFSWDNSDNIYDKQMQVRLREIERTKQRAAKLKKEAAENQKRMSGGPMVSKQKQSQGTSLLSGSVRSSLRDPAAARAAFVYGEVLGAPVSLRKGSAVPGLTD
jgi:hypothetical protein